MGGYGSVAGLRDLLEQLCGHAEEVQDFAGDTPEDWRVQVTVEPVD
ncbi:hypothetical protein [Micromonospora sp. KC207]|nr:hypothetical protein [Micromonospora sp. KC207]